MCRLTKKGKFVATISFLISILFAVLCVQDSNTTKEIIKYGLIMSSFIAISSILWKYEN